MLEELLGYCYLRHLEDYLSGVAHYLGPDLDQLKLDTARGAGASGAMAKTLGYGEATQFVGAATTGPAGSPAMVSSFGYASASGHGGGLGLTQQAVPLMGAGH